MSLLGCASTASLAPGNAETTVSFQENGDEQENGNTEPTNIPEPKPDQETSVNDSVVEEDVQVETTQHVQLEQKPQPLADQELPQEESTEIASSQEIILGKPELMIDVVLPDSENDTPVVRSSAQTSQGITQKSVVQRSVAPTSSGPKLLEESVVSQQEPDIDRVLQANVGRTIPSEIPNANTATLLDGEEDIPADTEELRGTETDSDHEYPSTSAPTDQAVRTIETDHLSALAAAEPESEVAISHALPSSPWENVDLIPPRVNQLHTVERMQEAAFLQSLPGEQDSGDELRAVGEGQDLSYKKEIIPSIAAEQSMLSSSRVKDETEAGTEEHYRGEDPLPVAESSSTQSTGSEETIFDLGALSSITQSSQVLPSAEDSSSGISTSTSAPVTGASTASAGTMGVGFKAFIMAILLCIILLVIVFRKMHRARHEQERILEQALWTKTPMSSDNPRTSQRSTPGVLKRENTVSGQPESMYSIVIEEDERASRSFAIPQYPQKKADVSGSMHWVPAGKSIEIHGHHIDGGMLYVGSKASESENPAFINTKLPVAEFDNYRIDAMGYWPSYSRISSEARGAYLAWLAGGKNDPNAAIGFVFLFYYGLERRVLVDYPEGVVDDEEMRLIKTEVTRLLNIYGSKSGSIRGYFSNFLSVLLLLERQNEKLYNNPIPENLKGYEIPFYLKAYLGQCSLDGIPMPAIAAYLWVVYDSTIVKRTPAQRCEQECKQLFMLRYEEKFGDGILLPQNKTRVKISYHAASSNLYRTSLNLSSYEKLPDITVLSSIRNKLEKLIDGCTNELDRYSRYLGRNGKEQGNKKALTLLPTELVVVAKKEQIRSVRDLLDTNDSIALPLSKLLTPILEEERPTREAMVALAKVLEMEGMGMEPDVLAYQYELTNENVVLVFPSGHTKTADRDNTIYLLNILVVELADAIARADGTVDAAELESIRQYLDSIKDLSPYQRDRLKKHLEFLQYTPVKESSIKKKLKAIPQSDLAVLLASVNRVVLADGIIDHAEIQFLERLYKHLDIDPALLYHQLHTPTESVAITKHDGEHALDFERVESLKKESAEVSSILSEIFMAEDDDEFEESQLPAEEDGETEQPLALDDDQMQFLVNLVSQPSWTRDELIALAEKHGIMLDGTLELMNEQSLDVYGIPITEGDDPLEILEEFRGRTVWQ